MILSNDENIPQEIRLQTMQVHSPSPLKSLTAGTSKCGYNSAGRDKTGHLKVDKTSDTTITPAQSFNNRRPNPTITPTVTEQQCRYYRSALDLRNYLESRLRSLRVVERYLMILMLELVTFQLAINGHNMPSQLVVL